MRAILNTGMRDTKLYVRNSDLNLWFSDIQLSLYEDGTGYSAVAGPGWEMRLLEKDIAPTTEEWLEVGADNEITLSANIGSSTRGDISTYLPFWIRIKIPRDQEVKNLTSISIRISATKNLVE